MISESKFLKLRDKTELHIQIKEVDSPVWLICTHGIGEHLGRHEYISNIFGRDFNILHYDLRGHGKSSGRRAYVERFEEFYEDLSEILKMLRDEYKMQKYVLFGHSLGGLITSGFVQNIEEDDGYPEAVFLSAPAVSVTGLGGMLINYAPVSLFEFLGQMPSMAIEGLVDLRKLSHNKNIYQDYIEDSYNNLKIHLKLVFEMSKAMRDVFGRPIRFRCPSTVVYGDEDIVVDPKSIENYFRNIERSTILKLYDGAYHEIHNESEKYRKDYFSFLRNTLLEVLYKG